jgi:DHA1 family multidrug resistance protein-like MFS transporter
MKDLIREAPIGQAIRFLSRNKLLQYPEERANFALPIQYATELNRGDGLRPHSSLGSKRTSDLGVLPPLTLEKLDTNLPGDLESLGMTKTKSRHYTEPYSNERFENDQLLALERTKTIPIIPQMTSDGIILVDWYTTDDPANPQNWSSLKRGFVTFLICAYTWVVYTGSSIYAPSEGGVMDRFGVNPTEASLPLALYVLAYGVGPLLFAPLSEISIIGRNPVYIITFVIFFALSFPTAVVDSFGGLLALRFFMGFFGSPALANGGATFSDMYSLLYVPYQLSWWVFSAWGGPALGPLMAGFAVSAKNWRWSLWEIVWMAAPMLLLLMLFMPETSTPNILLRRAKRLRQITGDSRLQSQSEIDQQHLSASGILVDALIKPIEITLKDPAILYVPHPLRPLIFNTNS